jgi:hypothetical protein
MNYRTALARSVDRLSRLSRVERREIRRRAWRAVHQLNEPARRLAYERTRDAMEHALVHARLAVVLGPTSAGEPQ